MGCCSIFMPLLLSGCYCITAGEIRKLLNHREHTRRKTVNPFRSGVFSSAKGLKYIL